MTQDDTDTEDEDGKPGAVSPTDQPAPNSSAGVLGNIKVSRSQAIGYSR